MAKTKKERAAEMLLQLVPLKKITNEVGTGGSIYDAFSEYMTTDAVQIYNTHKREIETLKTEKTNLLSSIQSLENARARVCSEKRYYCMPQA